jgi:hypothetical protein
MIEIFFRFSHLTVGSKCHVLQLKCRQSVRNNASKSIFSILAFTFFAPNLCRKSSWCWEVELPELLVPVPPPPGLAEGEFVSDKFIDVTEPEPLSDRPG